MAITEKQRIGIAELVIYIPFLLIGIFLSFRHGFNRSAGWLYTALFSLVRVVGACLTIATIAQPNNTSLYVGASITLGIGLSNLILLQLGLIGRAMASIRKSTTTFINPTMLRLVQLLVLVSLILTAVGGNSTAQSSSKTGVYHSSPEQQAGMALIIVGFVLLVGINLSAATQIKYAEEGEKRLVLAVGLAQPFLLVRLIYSAVGVFANDPRFGSATYDVHIQLGMCVVMEMVIIAILEGFGLTLRVIPKAEREANAKAEEAAAAAARGQNNGRSHSRVGGDGAGGDEEAGYHQQQQQRRQQGGGNGGRGAEAEQFIRDRVDRRARGRGRGRRPGLIGGLVGGLVQAGLDARDSRNDNRQQQQYSMQDNSYGGRQETGYAPVHSNNHNSGRQDPGYY